MPTEWPTYEYFSTTRTVRRKAAAHGAIHIHLREFWTRYFVTQHVHWDGTYKDIMPTLFFNHLYENIADGFGPGAGRHTEGFDWSHFRDSSPAAFQTMAELIFNRLWKNGSCYRSLDHKYHDFRRMLEQWRAAEPTWTFEMFMESEP